MAVKKKQNRVKISTLKTNPDNPRLIKDDDFYKLVDSLLRYSIILTHRPIVNKEGTIYAGNMRHKAIEHIVKMPEQDFNTLVHDKLKLDIEPIELWQEIRKTKSIPAEWVADAKDYSAEELKALVLLDNASFGEHDWDILGRDFEIADLSDFGIRVPDFAVNKNKDLLPIDDGMETVSFQVKKKPGVTDDNYALFEMLLMKDDKKIATDLVAKVKEEHNFEQLNEAFMYIINSFINQNK